MSVRKYSLLTVILLAAVLIAGCAFSRYEPVTAFDGKEERGAPVILIPGENTPDGKEGSEDSGLSKKGDTLLFAGDINITSYVTEAYKKAGGIGGVLNEGCLKEIQSADVFFANEEFPFSDRGEAVDDKEYTFCVPTSDIYLFKEMGLDGVTIANNHVMDYGREALLDTCETLDKAGILHTGAGKDIDDACEPAVFTVNGRKYAILGASRVMPDAGWFATRYQAGVFSAYQPEDLLNCVTQLKESNEYEAVAVYIHWGIERDEKPQEYQRTLGKQLIDAGADIVIGAHPHVLQGIEYYKGKPIVYSLGNFVFGSSIPRTALLKVTFYDGEEAPVLTLIPASAAFGYTQTLTDDDRKQEFYRYLESISFGIAIDENGTVSSLE